MLVYPVAATSLQEPTGLILAFLCALSWAAGTIYMKAIRIEGDLLAVTMWQIVVGVVVFGVGYLIVQGTAGARAAAASHLARRRSTPGCSAPRSRISSGTTSSARSRPPPPRSARWPIRWSA